MDPPEGRPDAIVRPAAARTRFEVERIAPAEDLAPFVDYHWVVRWDLDEPHVQQVIPQPRIHVAAEDGRLLVHGVSRDRFERRLTGRAHALGVTFHPTGFRPVLRRSVSTLRGVVMPAAEVLGGDDRAVARAVLGSEDAAEMVTAVEGWLRGLDPRRHPVSEAVGAWVALAEHDPSITRADVLADRVDVSLRTLQRLFAEHVGIGPKWVLQRFRILEAAAAAHREEDVDWAELAAELGFSDQAHLTRTFTAVVGTPPATYWHQATDAG